MVHKWRLSLLPLSIALLTAGDQPQPWKDKPVPEWNEDDTKQILADSPWAKSVKPSIDTSASNGRSRQGGGMGRAGASILAASSWGCPGAWAAAAAWVIRAAVIPVVVIPVAARVILAAARIILADNRGEERPADSEPPVLQLRWESAFPIREAELKSHDSNAPTLDDDAHYAIAVYGVPSRMTNGNSRSATDQLKKLAAIKRDGKKDLKPSSVEVLQRDNGPVILFLFPRSKEITLKDGRIEFGAKVGRLQFAQSFFVDDMIYQGEFEL